jgi:hypothetical protein
MIFSINLALILDVNAALNDAEAFPGCWLRGSSMTCLRLVPDSTTITKINLPAFVHQPATERFPDVLSSATKTASASSCRTVCIAIKLSRSSRFNSLMDDTVALPATCPVLAPIVSAQIRSCRNVFTR